MTDEPENTTVQIISRDGTSWATIRGGEPLELVVRGKESGAALINLGRFPNPLSHRVRWEFAFEPGTRVLRSLNLTITPDEPPDVFMRIEGITVEEKP